MTREVAIVSFAEFHTPAEEHRNEVELLLPVIGEALGNVGLTGADFTVSGSSDYLQGQPFAFVHALDAVGAWPPIRESHVEMDGAFALHEAWTIMQHDEEIETALVYAFGKPSRGDINRILALQTDPYLVAPLQPDATSLAGLQACALLESGVTESAVASVAARRTGRSVEELLAEPYYAEPLREHDLLPVTDGAAAIVLAAGDRARELCEHPVWIRGLDHRIEPASLGVRRLSASPSTTLAASASGVADGPVEVAELHAPVAHQELILRAALDLGPETVISPSGATNTVMVAGLSRIGAAAQYLADGHAARGLAHATSGPCLQQNLICVLEVT